MATLVERGLLVLPDGVRRRAAAVSMIPPETSRTVAVRHRVVAAVAFLLALVLLRLPFRVTTSAVSRFRRVLARRDASVDDALSALSAAYRVSRLYPGRVACLETSLTAVLAGALLGCRIDWCFGTAVDLQTFHAWIEVAGEPVTDPAEDPIPPTYKRVLLA